MSEASAPLGNWAGLVASVTDRGTFCVCSPFTNGQLGECRSCSDLVGRAREQGERQRYSDEREDGPYLQWWTDGDREHDGK